MKTEIEKLIDRLADKSLTFGCEFQSVFYNSRQKIVVKRPGSSDYWTTHKTTHIDGMLASDHVDESRVFGHPVLIGDVLKKIDSLGDANCDVWGYSKELVAKWSQLDYSKSLNSILEEVDWKYGEVKGERETVLTTVPEQPAISELFEFLLSLGL